MAGKESDEELDWQERQKELDAVLQEGCPDERKIIQPENATARLTRFAANFSRRAGWSCGYATHLRVGCACIQVKNGAIFSVPTYHNAHLESVNTGRVITVTDEKE